MLKLTVPYNTLKAARQGLARQGDVLVILDDAALAKLGPAARELVAAIALAQECDPKHRYRNTDLYDALALVGDTQTSVREPVLAEFLANVQAFVDAQQVAKAKADAEKARRGGRQAQVTEAVVLWAAAQPADSLVTQGEYDHAWKRDYSAPESVGGTQEGDKNAYGVGPDRAIPWDDVRLSAKASEVDQLVKQRNAERRAALQQAEAAKAAAKEADRQMVLAWIALNGSLRLQRIVKEGMLDQSLGVYLSERLKLQCPGWQFESQLEGESSAPFNPPMAAFALLDRARAAGCPDAKLMRRTITTTDACEDEVDGRIRDWIAEDSFFGRTIWWVEPAQPK